MLNRTEAPFLHEISSIAFTAPEIHSLNSHVNLYHMKDVANETARFDLYFDAGKIRGVNSIASFVNGLLLSGTRTKTSVQINGEIDALGGFLEMGISSENAVISIYCLRENLKAIFELLLDAIENVVFFEDEVNEYLADRKQKLQINRGKVSFLAQTAFQEYLFASDERYASLTKDLDFDMLTVDHLKAFHREHYLKGLDRIVVVGDLDSDTIDSLKLMCMPFLVEHPASFVTRIENHVGAKHIEKEDALQSAIRVGKILFNKKHEDYLDFLILQTLLGDYFGSRLMSNIREDKGYTYGIGSMVSEFQNTGYFLIATEVGKDVREETLKEICFEIERLQQELVPESELELVRNYMRGQLLKSADGPYAMMDLFLSAELQGKTLELYNEALVSINNITPERIQELAQRYLNWDSMSIVSAG